MLVVWTPVEDRRTCILPVEQASSANQLLNDGHLGRAAMGHRILNAIERLQAKAPAEGEKVH
jgi:hypothetical protein